MRPCSVIWTALVLFGPFSTVCAYDEIVVKNGATIAGTVKIGGKIPRLPPLQITKFREFCKDVPNEALMVGRGHGVRYAVVALDGIAKGKAVEKETTHELDNVQCRFVPHVQTARMGQLIVIKNSDPILHTAHARFRSGQPDFNVGLYPGRVTRRPLLTPGVARILCEVHPWMTAYIVIAEHPYQSVTDSYGKYVIEGVPPGNYKLKVWHEKLGIQEQRVDVKAGASLNFDFVFGPIAGETR
jgi:hypothetical protein